MEVCHGRVVKLEAKSGWGEVETIEIGTIKRRVVGLTPEEVGLTLAEGKNLIGERRLVLQTQMENIQHARVCPDRRKLRLQLVAERALCRPCSGQHGRRATSVHALA